MTLKPVYTMLAGGLPPVAWRLKQTQGQYRCRKLKRNACWRCCWIWKVNWRKTVAKAKHQKPELQSQWQQQIAELNTLLDLT